MSRSLKGQPKKTPLKNKFYNDNGNDKEALKIHGVAFEDDDSSSDSGKSTLDEEYYKYKPKPIAVNHSNVVIVRPLNINTNINKFAFTNSEDVKEIVTTNYIPSQTFVPSMDHRMLQPVYTQINPYLCRSENPFKHEQKMMPVHGISHNSNPYIKPNLYQSKDQRPVFSNYSHIQGLPKFATNEDILSLYKAIPTPPSTGNQSRLQHENPPSYYSKKDFVKPTNEIRKPISSLTRSRYTSSSINPTTSSPKLKSTNEQAKPRSEDLKESRNLHAESYNRQKTNTYNILDTKKNVYADHRVNLKDLRQVFPTNSQIEGLPKLATVEDVFSLYATTSTVPNNKTKTVRPKNSVNYNNFSANTSTGRNTSGPTSISCNVVQKKNVVEPLNEIRRPRPSPNIPHVGSPPTRQESSSDNVNPFIKFCRCLVRCIFCL